MDIKEAAKQQLAKSVAMIEFAVERGIELPDDAISAVIAANAITNSDGFDDAKALALIKASQQIANAIKPANTDSIKFSKKNEKGTSPAIKLAKSYNNIAVAVFIILVVCQGYWVVISES